MLGALVWALEDEPHVCAGCSGDSVVCDQDRWNTVRSGPAAGAPWPTPRWSHGWSSTVELLERVQRAIAALEPSVIVETGTFEGHAAVAMSRGAKPGARIVTIDYDGDPVPATTNTIKTEEWTELRRIREDNLAAARAARPDVTLTFLDGDSRLMLPGALRELERWGFWYQDSMHFLSGIEDEWRLMAPAAGERAVVVFDDVDQRHPWGRRFTTKIAPEAWCWRVARDGRRRQIWAQRVG